MVTVWWRWSNLGRPDVRSACVSDGGEAETFMIGRGGPTDPSSPVDSARKVSSVAGFGGRILGADQ
jgi:hypothetical protein